MAPHTTLVGALGVSVRHPALAFLFLIWLLGWILASFVYPTPYHIRPLHCLVPLPQPDLICDFFLSLSV